MPKLRALSLQFLLCILARAESAPPTLMPMPLHLTPAPGLLRIDSSFRVSLSGYQEPRLHRAVTRLIARLAAKTGIALTPRSATPLEPVTLSVACDHAGKSIQSLDEEESYRLEVTPAGAHLTAPQPLGLLRGVETFLQLVQAGPAGFEVPALVIEDRPRFPWRGLTYDVARHFMPAEQVKRTLDGMAAVKLNVLHWHLSDNQGFRVESRLFPRLQQAGSGGLYYTQARIREILAYARDRGIRVVPEFDIPGHSTAMLVAYPSLATDPAPPELDRLFGVMDPAIDPTKPGVYIFLDRFIGEMAHLFPDAYFHIGGDEVNGRLWRESVAIQRFKRAHRLLAAVGDPDANAALHALFNRRLQAILRKHGKHMEGWDEILSPALPKDIVIQSWRGRKSLADAVRLGYQGILSSGWYLDLALPAQDHYLVEPLDEEASRLSPDERKRILGGEAAMWSEWVTPETMDSRVWPRAAVIAERLWSPRETRDVPDMYRRLEYVSRELEWLGLTHRSCQPLMFQRLAGTQDPDPLSVLAEMVEPVKNYNRERFGPYTTLTPFIQLVDAVPPESEVARHFATLVAHAMEIDGPWEQIRLQLIRWQRNRIRIAPLTKANALLDGVDRLSANAEEITGIGLEAITAIEAGKKPDAAWVERNVNRVAALSSPSAALSLIICPQIIQLIRYAAK